MQMTLRQFIKNVEQVVAQTKGNMALKLQRGSLTGMEQYNREVGRAEGLENCVALMKDMLNKMEDADRDKDLPSMTGTDND